MVAVFMIVAAGRGLGGVLLLVGLAEHRPVALLVGGHHFHLSLVALADETALACRAVDSSNTSCSARFASDAIALPAMCCSSACWCS